jgi:hypothetical protein
MVWVQQVDILYTKASRGAPQATVRNRLPRAFRIYTAGEDVFYFEHYELLESKDFVSTLQDRSSAVSLPKRKNDLVMELSENILTLGLIWNQAIGQPRRQSHSGAVTIKPGQTARLSINGRYTSYSGQIYTEATYNVAFGDRISNEIFTRADPDSVFDLRADLF